MASGTYWFRVRSLERVFLLLVSVVMALLFSKLFNGFKKDFEEVPMGLKEGTMMNLNDDKPAVHIKLLLEKGFYFKDQKDIELISSVISSARNTSSAEIDNIGELNLSKYNINADDAFIRGGESFKKRVLVSRILLGFSGSDSTMFEQERKSPLQAPAVNHLSMGDHSISGRIIKAGDQPVPGTLVRLKLIVPQDSVYSSGVSEVENISVEFINNVRKEFILDSANHKQLLSFSAYARTDNQGTFSFTGLPGNQAFEILPLQPGYQFGGSQGVSQLNEAVQFTFRQSPQIIKLFSTKDFSNLKKEKAFIVRTPEEVTHWFWIIISGFFGAFSSFIFS